ncbi:TIGR03084 family metal-binding protein [Flavisphingomonas formosensis]|uniref:TIGR03084 family metal-binding protein n=1 Tax=Flavisphingomonas formosensis TaxID=861534 RepID=UPI0012F763B2|nr:TIGR03084 family metal-binding protein [Sphingomonas formosensis]
MDRLIADVRQEYADLDAFLQGVTPDQWDRRTLFYGWTIADEVMHLHQVDEFGRVALTDPASFPTLVADVRAGQAQGIELSQRMRADWGHLPPRDLLDLWRAGWTSLCDLFAASDPQARMPWFGPEMSVASFAAARQMEVWAHGQDIYDLLRVRRTNGDRIRAICDLGVRTHGWSFRNRGLEKPPAPQVRLAAPSRAEWIWNAGASESIAGPAEDFALVVTQRRHVDDTALLVRGEGARAWMEIAQCFAGAPATGPAKGVRVGNPPPEGEGDRP